MYRVLICLWISWIVGKPSSMWISFMICASGFVFCSRWMSSNYANVRRLPIHLYLIPVVSFWRLVLLSLLAVHSKSCKLSIKTILAPMPSVLTVFKCTIERFAMLKISALLIQSMRGQLWGESIKIIHTTECNKKRSLDLSALNGASGGR